MNKVFLPTTECHYVFLGIQGMNHLQTHILYKIQKKIFNTTKKPCQVDWNETETNERQGKMFLD